MEEERRRLLQEALQRLSQRMPQRRYHPERHYMRGPGPKTLSKIGEMLRAETESFARETDPPTLARTHSCNEKSKGAGLSFACAPVR
jgi:hypothetical protein